MTTPDFPDWTTPVGLLDQAEALTVAGQTITAGGAAVTVDTSGVASVTIQLYDLVSTVADMYVLTANWLENGLPVAIETLSLWGVAAPGFGPGNHWQLPARGGQLQLVLSGTAAPSPKVVIVGSSRDVQDARCSSRNSVNGRLLVDTGAVVVNAGASSAGFPVPPVTKRLALRDNFTISAVQLQLNAVQIIGGVVGLTPFEYFSTPAGIAGSFIAEAPFQATQLVMVNGDTAAHSIHAYVWDVS